MNFGCPVRKVTKTGAGASLLDDPELACRLVAAVAAATSLPVSVKMRRGVENGSRTCLDVGPAARRGGRELADAASSLGEADVHGHRRPLAHGRARLARRRSGDRIRRHHLARPRTVGARDDRRCGGDGRARRAGQSLGAREIMGEASDPSREEVVAELAALHARDGARARRAPRDRASSRSSTAGTSAAAVSRGPSSRSS